MINGVDIMDLNFIPTMPASGFMPGGGKPPLTPGQVLPARLMMAEENMSAQPLLLLAGNSYTARGDLPVNGDFFWVRVEEVAWDQIRVKLLPADSRPDGATKTLLLALGLKQNKEHEAVVKLLLRWRLPLSRELVHDFINTARDLPPEERPAFWASRAFLSTLVFKQNGGETETTPTELLQYIASGQRKGSTVGETDIALKELLQQLELPPEGEKITPTFLTKMLNSWANEDTPTEPLLKKRLGPQFALRPGLGKMLEGKIPTKAPTRATGPLALKDNPKKMAAAVNYLLRRAGATAEGQQIINRSRPMNPGQEAVYILSFIRGKDEGDIFIIHPDEKSEGKKPLASPRLLVIRLFTAVWGQVWIQLAFQDRTITARVWAENSPFLPLARAAELKLKDRINAAGWELVKLTVAEQKIATIADLIEPPEPGSYRSLDTLV